MFLLKKYVKTVESATHSRVLHSEIIGPKIATLIFHSLRQRQQQEQAQGNQCSPVRDANDQAGSFGRSDPTRFSRGTCHSRAPRVPLLSNHPRGDEGSGGGRRWSELRAGGDHAVAVHEQPLTDARHGVELYCAFQ